jgi:peptide/nickel transport system permease protein
VRPVFLISDVAVWALVATVAAFLLYARTRPQYVNAWRQIRIRKAAMMCSILLLLYAAVGVLDSFHFQKRAYDPQNRPAVDAGGKPVYQTEILSVLDVVLSNLRSRTEKTYSLPLATHALMKENIQLPDGRRIRDYPKLEHGGAHLKDPAGAPGDIAWRCFLGALFGAVPGALTIFLLRRRALWMGAFIAVLAVVLGVSIALASGYHLFGTNKVGQDVLYLGLKGCRTALILGLVTTLIVTPFAIAFGIVAGYFGGKADDAIQYIYTTLGSIPSILLISAAMLVVITRLPMGQTARAADVQLFWLCVVLGVIGWTGLCRLLRGEALKLREVEYVQAAHAFGVAHVTVMLRHIVPNVMHIVLISMVLRFSGLVLAEAVLAYVGIGVHPSTDSWGNMINAARLEVSRDPMIWWNLLAAFVFMFGLVLPANIFGDAVRDALDPRLRTE